DRLRPEPDRRPIEAAVQPARPRRAASDVEEKEVERRSLERPIGDRDGPAIRREGREPEAAVPRGRRRDRTPDPPAGTRPGPRQVGTADGEDRSATDRDVGDGGRGAVE